MNSPCIFVVGIVTQAVMTSLSHFSVTYVVRIEYRLTSKCIIYEYNRVVNGYKCRRNWQD